MKAIRDHNHSRETRVNLECVQQNLMTDQKKAEQFVYISCVDEVRYSFVSHLSESLRRNGLSVFIDTDDLLSNEAQEKVERARVVMMVFFANLKVCIEKFEKIRECKRNNEQVEVSVLLGDSKLHGEWLSVLNLRGLSPLFQSRNESSDSKLVEEIVRYVNEKLLFLGRIGIYLKLSEIVNMVNKQPLGIRSVGIWGMPGIGKTELAKAVFDQVSGGFDSSCFIEDFDKAFHENRVYRILVEQLMKDEPGNGSTITKLRLRRDKLKNKRILVVLDDVRNPLVAESFLEEFEWFGPESLIIITSSDKQVFRLCRINQIYEVQCLNEKEARQLFMLCASINDMGEQNLHEVVTEVIKYSNGNPLALSIYGDELKGKKRSTEMETAFLKLKERPPDKFVDAIKRSYDTLNDSEKNIFLDIACFFQGENVDYVMQLLEGCGFFPHVGIDVLVEKCLVTVSENRLRMHNLIQDFGREIINSETVHIKRRSRLWEPHDIKYLLEDNELIADQPKTTSERAQSTEEIEGIFLDTSDIAFDIMPTAFVNMPNLRLLKIYCSNPENLPGTNVPPKGLIHSLPNQLRLLHWENYHLQYLPQNFDPSYLVEINMSYSQLQKLWGGTKNLEMLRTIRLCHSHLLVDIDDLSKAQNLEVIDLQGCTRLQSFPATSQLLHLRVVNLSGCTEINDFPEAPPNIEKLHLQGTGITELPLSTVKPTHRELLNLLTEIPGLPGVSKLEYSDLERLTSLMKVSSSTQDLGRLICLDLKDCYRLRSLPNMVNLELLTVLDLSGCLKLESIQGFPRKLKELYLTGTAVREVPQLPQSLELFNAHGCVSLKSIPLDSKKLPMHYICSNCFNLSPQVVNDFLVKVLGNVNHIPSKLPQEQNEAPVFSFCAPSHVTRDSTLDLQQGSSVMIRLNPSWKSTLMGFALLVEVSFSEDYYDANGFGISCVCRWKNKGGYSHRIERNLHCWAAGKAASKVHNNHMFVFCDTKMLPLTGEGNDPNILADLVVFEFFPFNKEKKLLDGSCTVTRCGVYAITGNTDLKMSSPVFSLDPTVFSGFEVNEVLREYDGLEETDKALFRYIACLFNDEDVDLVAPHIASIDLDNSSGLNELASRSLIRISANGDIAMHSFLRKMGQEILHSQSMLPSSSKCLTGDVEKVRSQSMLPTSSKDLTGDVEKVHSQSMVPSSSKDLTGDVEKVHSQSMLPSSSNDLTRDDKKKQWQRTLIDISSIAGYDYRGWDNEADMNAGIVTNVSKKLMCTPSVDFDGLVGIDAHITKIIPLLRLESKEVKMVGIWGPSGIGKSTIARCLFNQISSKFQCCANVKLSHLYTGTQLFDGNSLKLYYQQQVLAQVLNQRDVEIRHLGVMQERLRDTKVLLILDDVDHRLALDAVAGNSNWFGPGSRIIVITKDLYLLKSHRMSYIYRVDLPSKKEALQMLCQYTFETNSPPDGFMELLIEVAEIAGYLPLGLQVYGSYFRGKSKLEWYKEMPRLRNRLDGEIESILKSGYDELCDEERGLFLHISCLFNHDTVDYLKRLLTSRFCDIDMGFRLLAGKSLIHISEHGTVTMHHLQQKLGREIVRKEFIHEPGRRLFLVDCADICEVLAENTGTRRVVGISLNMSEIEELFIINPRCFREMSNLMFVKFYKNLWDKEVKVDLPDGLDYLSHKLRLLHWEGFPMKCMPSNFIPKHLVELKMVACKLEELWSGIQPFDSLKCMNLRGSLDLREVPDLSCATNLETLDLAGCSSLTKLPSSIGNLHNLKGLDMERCTFLEVLPTGIDLESLNYLNLNGCSRLRSFPEISRSISNLYLDGTAIEEVPGFIENITMLSYLSMNSCKKLKKISPNISKLKVLMEVDFSRCEALTEYSWQNHPEDICTSLKRVDMSYNSFQTLPDTWTSIQPKDLDLGNCRNLVSLPELPASLSILTANYCDSLESVYGSFDHPQMVLQFINCFKLNHQARDFILLSDCAYAILPGEEVYQYFDHRAVGNFLIVSLPRVSLSRKILKFKACIVVESRVCLFDFGVIWHFKGGTDKKYFILSTDIHSKTNHLIMFGFEFSLDGFGDHPAELNYGDVQFEFFCLDHKKDMIHIKECGAQLMEVSPSQDYKRKRFETEDGKSRENVI